MPGKPVSDPKFSVPDLNYAYEQVLSHSEQDSAEYVDAHTWYFTPSSFELIVLELGLLGIMDFTTDILVPTSDRFEFYVTLKRGAPAVPADGGAGLRMELLTKTQRELGQQVATLAAETGNGAATGQIEKRWQEKHRRLSARLKKLERRVGMRAADKGHRRKGKTRRRGKSSR